MLKASEITRLDSLTASFLDLKEGKAAAEANDAANKEVNDKADKRAMYANFKQMMANNMGLSVEELESHE